MFFRKKSFGTFAIKEFQYIFALAFAELYSIFYSAYSKAKHPE